MIWGETENKSLKGKIQMIIGPMFSGKSTELLRRVKRYTIAKKECIVLKYQEDTRYSQLKVSTHDKMMWEAKPVLSLMSAKKECLDSKISIIGIDEGQFFPDLIEFCLFMVDHGKTVIVAGLNGTFQQKPFGQILDLIPFAEDILKLSAVCMRCGADATFSKKINGQTDQQIEIGGSEMYSAVCRNCL